MNDNENLKSLYNTLQKEGYTPPAFEQFAKDMEDDGNLRGVYSTLQNEGYTPPDYDTFRSDMGFGNDKPVDLTAAKEGSEIGANAITNIMDGRKEPQPGKPKAQAGSHAQMVVDEYDRAAKAAGAELTGNNEKSDSKARNEANKPNRTNKPNKTNEPVTPRMQFVPEAENVVMATPTAETLKRYPWLKADEAVPFNKETGEPLYTWVDEQGNPISQRDLDVRRAKEEITGEKEYMQKTPASLQLPGGTTRGIRLDGSITGYVDNMMKQQYGDDYLNGQYTTKDGRQVSGAEYLNEKAQETYDQLNKEMDEARMSYIGADEEKRKELVDALANKYDGLLTRDTIQRSMDDGQAQEEAKATKRERERAQLDAAYDTAYARRAEAMNENMRKAQEEYENSSWLDRMFGGNPVQRAYWANQNDRRIQIADTQMNIVLDARKIIDAGEAYDKGETWAGRLVRGMGDALTDTGLYDSGVEDMHDLRNVKNALDAYEAGTATKEQKELLDVYALLHTAQGENADAMGGWYGAGGTTVQALPFMAQMAINPASNLGRATMKAATKWGVKQFGKTAMNKYLKRMFVTSLKAGGRVTGDALAAVLPAFTFGAPAITADTYDRLIGNVHGTEDEAGNIRYKNRSDFETSKGAAIAKAAGANLLEYQSEMAGPYFGALSKIAKTGTLKGLEKIGLEKTRDFLTRFSNKDFYRAYASFARKTQWHGTFEEYLEEVYNNVANAIFIGDMDFSTGDNGVFNLEMNLDTLLGVAVMSGAMSTLKTVDYARTRGRIKGELDEAYKSGLDIFGTDEWERITDRIDGLDDDKAASEIRKIINGVDGKERKHAVVNYAAASFMNQGLNMGELKNSLEQISDAAVNGGVPKDAIPGIENLTPEEQQNVHEDGMIHTALLYPTAENGGEPQEVFITKGNVVMRGDGTVDTEASSDAIYYKGSDGQVHMTSPDKIQSVNEPVSVEDYAATGEMNEPNMANKPNTTEGFAVGDEVNVNIDDEQAAGEITGMTEDGLLIVSYETPDGTISSIRISPDELRNMNRPNDEQPPMGGAGAVVEEPTGQNGNIEQQNIGSADLSIPENGNIGDENISTEEESAESIESAGSAGNDEEEVIPKDEDGNPRYHDAPVEATISDLYDGSLDDAEVQGFINANINEAQKRYDNAQKKAPKIGTNKAKYLEQKRKWQADVDEAKRVLDYWNEVNAQKESITHTTPQEIEAAQAELSGQNAREEYAAMNENVPTNSVTVASDFIRGAKITPESFRAETGYGAGEQRRFVGMIATEQNGGKSIDRLAEELVSYDNAELNGVTFNGDTSTAKDAILEALQGAGTRGELAVDNTAEQERYAEARRAELDAQYMEAYGMTYEDYLAYEEQNLPEMLRKYANFDEVEFYNLYADEIELTLNSRINEQGNDTTGEEPRAGGGDEVLLGEGTDNARGSAGGTEQGTEVPAGVQGRVAERIARAEEETDVNPTEAQKEAGNYKKGHVKIDGFDVTIENPKGSVRSGKDADGTPWSVTMNNTYGYIRGTEGVDGDHIDVYLSDNPTEGNVFVIDQVNSDGSFDEHKVMYGFNSAEEARDAYLANYSPGWQGLGTITEVTKDEFKKWVNSSHRKTKPFAEYKNVKKEGGQNEGENNFKNKAENLWKVVRFLNNNYGYNFNDEYSFANWITKKKNYKNWLNDKFAPWQVKDVIKAINEYVEAFNNQNSADGGVRLMVADEGRQGLSDEDVAIRDAVVERLRESGLEVITDVEEGQRVLDEANGRGERVRTQAALNGLKKASDFILSALSEKTKQRRARIEIPERANRLAEEAIGHPIKSHAININELTHIKKRHGENGTANDANSIPLRDKDIALMPYIMAAPTRVVKGNMAANGTESVRYEKDLENGVVVVVEREGRFDVEDMENITMWANKKPATNVTVATKTSHSTSETIVISEADAAKIRKDAETAIENDGKITGHVRFFRTADGEAYGFTVGGKIYIDPRVATADTPIHEYAHLWASALRQGNQEEWRNVVGLMKGTPVWEEVKRKYPELTTDDEIADEVLATYSGRRGAERLKEEARKATSGKPVTEAARAVTAIGSVREALRKFWQNVADFLHIHYTSAEEVADRVMRDLLEGVNPAEATSNNEKSDGEARNEADTPRMDDIRFRKADEDGNPENRSSNKHRELYEKRVNKRLGVFNRAWFDSMQPVKALQDAIVKETGQEIKPEENVYLNENRAASVAMRNHEVWERTHMEPVRKEIVKLMHQIMGGNKLTKHLHGGKTRKGAYNAVVKYMKSKHGLENNEYRRNEEAMNARTPFENEIEEVEKAVKDGKMPRQDADKRQAELKEQADKAEQNSRAKTLKKDYSGLQGIYGEDFERKAKEYVADFESQFDTAPFWREWNGATKAILKEEYDAGLISKELYDKIRGMYEYYIPLKGWAENRAEDVYTYYTTGSGDGGKPHRREGRTSESDDPLVILEQDADRQFTAAARNRMKQTLYNLATGHKTSLLTVRRQWYVNNGTKENPDWERRDAEIPGNATPEEMEKIISDFEKDMRKKQKEGTAMRQKKPMILPYHATKRMEKEHTVRVMVNGKEYVIYVNGDPAAAQAVNGTSTPKDPDNEFVKKWILGPWRWWMRAKASLLTAINLNFIPSNLSRDALYSIQNMKAKEPAGYVARYAKNLVGCMVKMTSARLFYKDKKGTLDMNDPTERLFKEFLDNGGETGYTVSHTLEQRRRRNMAAVNKLSGVDWTMGLRMLADSIEYVNRSVETIVRFSAYKTSREAGRSIPQSINDAKEASVNFDKHGSGELGNKEWRLAYIFANVQFQSLRRLLENASGHPVRFTLAQMERVATGFVVPMIAKWMLDAWGDDDEKDAYEELPEWMRQSGLAVPLSPILRYVGADDAADKVKRLFLYLPLGPEDKIWYALGEMSYHVFNSDMPTEDMAKKFGLLAADLLPVDFQGYGGNMLVNLAPSVVQDAVALEQNVDYWGRPIYKEDMPYNEQEPGHNKAFIGTPEWFVKRSKEINALTGGDDYTRGAFSPKPEQIEYAVNQTGGGVSRVITQLMSLVERAGEDGNKDVPLLKNIPVLSSIVKQSEPQDGQEGYDREKYYGYMDEYEKTQHDYKAYKKGAKGGDAEAAEKAERLKDSPEGKRMEAINEKIKKIERKDRRVREIDRKEDPTQEEQEKREELKAESNELKQQLVEELDSISNAEKK